MYSQTERIQPDIESMKNIIILAGDAIMNIYRQDFDVIQKEDGSPVTLADKLANEIICNYLIDRYGIPVLSEENEDISYNTRKDWINFWMIDPLDGTKEFIHRRREFTVNIALIHKNRPVFGMIYAPHFKELFWAEIGGGSYFEYHGQIQRLAPRRYHSWFNKTLINQQKKHTKLILSRSHSAGFDCSDYISNEEQTLQTIAMGSSLKFCRIAQGLVNLNIRMQPTMEWDTAAADPILRESGCRIIRYSDEFPLDYNKIDLTNPPFVAI